MGKKRDDNSSTSAFSPNGGAEVSEEEYIVRRILGKRNVKGKTEYLLKWQGYSTEESTWEPEYHLNCPELMEKFERKLQLKKEQKRAEKLEKERKRAEKLDDKNTETPKRRGRKRKSESEALPSTDDKKAKRKNKKPKGSQEGPKDGATGFDRGLTPDKILGATDSAGQLMFLMQWKDTDGTELVPAKIANTKCPQVVISFYEGRLT